MTKSTAVTKPRLADTTPESNDPKTNTATPEVSLRRLYFLRSGYALVAVGLVLTKWPLILDHLINPEVPWPLYEGVETCMLVALSLLFFLGIRYPLQMLPILLFEMGWKFIWTAVVVIPAVDRRSVGSGHRVGVLCLPRGVDRGRGRSLALRRRPVRDEAGGPVAPGGGPQRQ